MQVFTIVQLPLQVRALAKRWNFWKFSTVTIWIMQIWT